MFPMEQLQNNLVSKSKRVKMNCVHSKNKELLTPLRTAMYNFDEASVRLELKKLIDITITGPVSPDIAFSPEKRCHYDLAVCMYHDQALITIKTLDFHHGVNVTLGLDFIRTSPDHGTAFDIVGKSLANPESLISAINLAYEMSYNKKNA